MGVPLEFLQPIEALTLCRDTFTEVDFSKLTTFGSGSVNPTYGGYDVVFNPKNDGYCYRDTLR